MNKVQDAHSGLAKFLTILTLGIFRFFTVPQGYIRVIIRFGKFIREAPPGMSHCLSIWGLWQKVGSFIPTKEQVRDYSEELVYTRDGVECIIDTVVFFRIANVEKAIYEIEDYEIAIENLVQAILRSECGDLSTSDLLRSRKALAKSLQETLDTDTDPWGIEVRLVELKGIKISTKNEQGAKA